MLTLFLANQASKPLASLGLLDPHPPLGAGFRVYDFGTARIRDVRPSQLLSVGRGDPAAVSFAPDLVVRDTTSMDVDDGEAMPMAANRTVIRLATKRQRVPIPQTFITGYDTYAAPMARYWRDHGVGAQPLLAAGVFALSSIQTPIVTALRLFSMLTPYVVDDQLPSVTRLRDIVRDAGAGLDSPTTGRPRWYVEYDGYRAALAAAIDMGLRDDALRRAMSVETALPRGLGLAKLSFTLALVGNNLGCLDARILNWAFTKASADRFNRVAGRKRNDGTMSPKSYDAYRRAELRILERDSPFFDAHDPVGLARSQWMLWESLGPETDRTHTHEELFQVVVEDRLDEL